jgi:hypothetical protein
LLLSLSPPFDFLWFDFSIVLQKPFLFGTLPFQQTNGDGNQPAVRRQRHDGSFGLWAVPAHQALYRTLDYLDRRRRRLGRHVGLCAQYGRRKRRNAADVDRLYHERIYHVLQMALRYETTKNF